MRPPPTTLKFDLYTLDLLGRVCMALQVQLDETISLMELDRAWDAMVDISNFGGESRTWGGKRARENLQICQPLLVRKARVISSPAAPSGSHAQGFCPENKQ